MTQPNLFRPPDAVLADIHPAATTKTAPRPISAWLLEGLLVFALLAAFVGLWRLAWLIALDWQRVQSPAGVALAIAIKLGLVASLATSLWSIHRAKAWARWLGLLLIAGFAAVFVLQPDTTAYANAAERAGGELAHILLLPVLCIWWGWAFAFSDKARRYFSPRMTDAA